MSRGEHTPLDRLWEEKSESGVAERLDIIFAFHPSKPACPEQRNLGRSSLRRPHHVAEPLFTGTVVATVAIAIAANATIFTVVNAVLIRALPFAEPNRILQVAEKNDKLNLPTFGASVLNFLFPGASRRNRSSKSPEWATPPSP